MGQLERSDNLMTCVSNLYSRVNLNFSYERLKWVRRTDSLIVPGKIYQIPSIGERDASYIAENFIEYYSDIKSSVTLD